MKVPNLLLAGLIIGSLVGPVQPLQAQSGGCALLKPADLTALLGGTVVAKPVGNACNWSIAGGAKRLLSIVPRAAGPAAAMAFAGARQNLAREANGTVTDETGLGEKAFSSLTSFGAVVMMLKKGHLLQLQYWTGAVGTAQDLSALRPVAKKAIAAF